eukprot:5397981-Lingulodinium_polyedra.AAC.1
MPRQGTPRHATPCHATPAMLVQGSRARWFSVFGRGFCGCGFWYCSPTAPAAPANPQRAATL